MARKCNIDFKTAFCAKHDCDTAKFESKVFKICLRNGSKAIANIIKLVSPKFFVYDFELIEKAGRATTSRQVGEAIANYFFMCGYKRNVFHDNLRIRISCTKLQDLATNLLEQGDEAVL